MNNDAFLTKENLISYTKRVFGKFGFVKYYFQIKQRIFQLKHPLLIDFQLLQLLCCSVKVISS